MSPHHQDELNPIDTPKVSGYIPCYNNASTIVDAIEGLRNQSMPVDEIFVVDDGSTDKSVKVTRETGVEVVVHSRNLGRGATRRDAMEKARHEFVLCCDATNSLEPDFLKKAIRHFKSEEVCSVSGRIMGKKPRSAVDRWRSRHLFKEQVVFPKSSQSKMLITYGTLMRRSSVLEVGNFNANLRHTEDHELGNRLLAAGHQIWGDSTLIVTSLVRNTLREIMERYWRWHAGKDEKFHLGTYWHDIKGSIKPMASTDLAQKDWICACISLMSPHYRFLKTIKNAVARKYGRQTNRTNA